MQIPHQNPYLTTSTHSQLQLQMMAASHAHTFVSHTAGVQSNLPKPP